MRVTNVQASMVQIQDSDSDIYDGNSTMLDEYK